MIQEAQKCRDDERRQISGKNVDLNIIVRIIYRYVASQARQWGTKLDPFQRPQNAAIFTSLYWVGVIAIVVSPRHHRAAERASGGRARQATERAYHGRWWSYDVIERLRRAAPGPRRRGDGLHPRTSSACARRPSPTPVAGETTDYGTISNSAIRSPSRAKKYRRSIGLPGKLPVSWLVTTIR